MTAPAFRIVALLACMGAASAAQQPPAQTLDEVNVAAPEERERGRGPVISMGKANVVALELDTAIRVQLQLVQEQTQVAFRRESAARRLPGGDDRFSRINRRLHLQLLPDRLNALEKPWIRDAGYLLDANIDEADGVPAYIPFGPDVALVNLDYVGLRDSQPGTVISLTSAVHPQTRQCQERSMLADYWPAGTNPYILLAGSMKNCTREMQAREGDLVFADSVPAGLRHVVQELYDPLASRLSNRLGSEPGNMFVAWWEDSPHEGYRLEPGWSRNSLLLFHGAGWQQQIDAVQRDALRMSFMREQIQRRIRESDWPGPFTQSAVSYLVSLTRSEEEHATLNRLRQELPVWIAGCDGRLHAPAGTAMREDDVSSIECGLVLQFVYDAVARAKSAGERNIYDTWRELLDASYRRGKSGATPGEFLASSADARRIAQGLVNGSLDWSEFAAALSEVGVQLRAVPGGSSPAFEVLSLEHFED